MIKDEVKGRKVDSCRLKSWSSESRVSYCCLWSHLTRSSSSHLQEQRPWSLLTLHTSSTYFPMYVRRCLQRYRSAYFRLFYPNVAYCVLLQLSQNFSIVVTGVFWLHCSSLDLHIGYFHSTTLRLQFGVHMALLFIMCRGELLACAFPVTLCINHG